LILGLLKRLTREQKTATLMGTHSLEAAAIADVVIELARRKDRRSETEVIGSTKLFWRLMMRPLRGSRCVRA